MNNNEKTLWTIKGKSRYVYLCSKGIYPIEIEPNVNCPSGLLYCYK